MRFVDGMRGVTPILSAVPGPETLSRPDGTHSGNADVRAKLGQAHVVMWAFNRPGGGCGVGFTGGHYHLNFADPNFRKLVLNAIVWIAGVEVPANGVDLALRWMSSTSGPIRSRRVEIRRINSSPFHSRFR